MVGLAKTQVFFVLSWHGRPVNTVSNYLPLKRLRHWLGGLWYLMPLKQFFSCIEVISFIGAGNQSTRRKPLTLCKSPTNLLRQWKIKLLIDIIKINEAQREIGTSNYSLALNIQHYHKVAVFLIWATTKCFNETKPLANLN